MSYAIKIQKNQSVKTNINIQKNRIKQKWQGKTVCPPPSPLPHPHLDVVLSPDVVLSLILHVKRVLYDLEAIEVSVF